MIDIYTDGKYLKITKTWHMEDSCWKAAQIAKFIDRNCLQPKSVGEIGCGAGLILAQLARHPNLDETKFKGFDISPQAIELCQGVKGKNIEFACRNLLADDDAEHFDLLLAIDVFEHVPDYLNFLEACKRKATYKIYHIPLDVSVSAVLRNSFIRVRRNLGHLHYFTADTALETLCDTGHEITDYIYTYGALGLYMQHPTFARALANLPRWFFSHFSVPFTAKIFGGYSLLVLAK